MLHRREMLLCVGVTALAAVAASYLPAQGKQTKRILVFTRSQKFEHDCVKLNNGTCLVHETWKKLAAANNFEVECTKDGRIFEPDTMSRFDAFFFFTTGDLTEDKSDDGTPPMTKAGKMALLNAIANGKGFIGSHCAADTFHSAGEREKAQSTTEYDPYIQMLGGEFIRHGPQQVAKMHVVSREFPGIVNSPDFSLNEEWYSLKNFSKDLHVILVQETAGMKGSEYQRPKYPATWARQHGRGRVYYTSMGHRDDVWTNPIFQNMLVGAVHWVTGQVNFDLKPNLEQSTPEAGTMPPLPEKKK